MDGVRTIGKMALFGFLSGATLAAAVFVYLEGPQNTSYKIVSIFLLLTLASNLMVKTLISYLEVFQKKNE